MFKDNRTKWKEKKSLASHWNTKHELGREMYTDQCNLKERIRLAWFRLEI
jgi:hypothetical protein